MMHNFLKSVKKLYIFLQKYMVYSCIFPFYPDLWKALSFF